MIQNTYDADKFTMKMGYHDITLLLTHF